MSISNTKILVVGGGSGMGLALARRCLDAGARVVIAGRGEDRLRQAREALGNPAGLDVAIVDITREDQVAALFQRLGGLDHIVSTAADIEGAYQLLPALELKAAQRVVESKLYGPLLLAKHGAPRLSAMSSGWPIRPTGSRSAISASVSSFLSPATCAQIEVSTQPGDTALTRIGASSTASARTSPSSAALTAATTEPRGAGR